jgi:hypothetical protein
MDCIRFESSELVCGPSECDIRNAFHQTTAPYLTFCRARVAVPLSAIVPTTTNDRG